jgi:hypothetical protein
MDQHTQLPVQFKRELTERPGHFRIDDFVRLNSLLRNTLKSLQLMGF